MTVLRHHINSTHPRTAAKYESSEIHNNDAEKKIHSNSCIRAIRTKLLRWTTQKFRDRLMQVIFLTFIICIVMSSVDRFYSSASAFRHNYPRVVGFNRDNMIYDIREMAENNAHRHREVEALSEVTVKLDDSADPFEEGDCKAMHPWQVEYNIDCNRIHEIDGLRMEHLAQGGFRDVWWIRDGDGTDAVVKTLVFSKKFRQREMQRHQRDANTYAALQSSVHVPSIYGYCTNTAVFDYSEEGNLDRMIDHRHALKWTSEEKLRYAWQVTKALADVHSVGNIHNSASVSHTDVSPDQFLWMDGMFKLNDFNRARFIRWNKVKQEACPFYISVSPGSCRSPEEYTKGSPLTEKIDVYSLGNIMYGILLGVFAWEEISSRKVKKLVKKGTFPDIPKEKFEAFDDKERAIEHAIRMCYVKDIHERSTAQEVEGYLRKKLKEFNVAEFDT